MKPKIRRKLPARGFALIVTLSLMILLTVIAVGLLSLSSISLRSATAGDADARAFANARLAVLMAIGELQKEAGDDRRITADASILSKTNQPHLVGTWTSWSPGQAAKPDQAAPDYPTQKTALFRSWLVSSPDFTALKKPTWSETSVPVGDPKWIRLFSIARHGFDLSAQSVPLPKGGMAWAVSQENTKAKINVPGPETETAVNVALQAQRRPSLALASNLKQPEGGYNLRANRVLSPNQVSLDSSITTNATTAMPISASYTVNAQGLLTDAVKGGLKTDLNLGFEMSDSDFAKSSWSGVPNPFRSPNANMGFSSPNSYQGQRALFQPLVENPIVATVTSYGVASISHRFYSAGVPTFDHLRSFYQIPTHLYGGSAPVVAERGADHVAVSIAPASKKSYFPPANPPEGLGSSLSIRPVLNRMLYLLSTKLDANNQAQLVITPVISLWNPYNIRMEIDGAVAYPWMDLPFLLYWEFKSANGMVVPSTTGMADTMGKQFEKIGQSRQVDPYFLCEMTANGDGNLKDPIRFEPGEVRVFTPTSSIPVDFNRQGSNAERTIRMRPVDDISLFNKKGGFKVSMQNGVAGHGFKYDVKPTEQVRIRLQDISKGKYHYFVSLEDSARIKNPADSTRGQAVTDVQILNLTSAVTEIASPFRTQAELKADTFPFGVIETYHRTAQQNVGGQAVADLMYTTNPRHSSINHQLAAGSFTVAPHFQSTLRAVSSFDDAIQTSIDGRRSFWGPAHSASGKDQLPFFEIPRQPLLSLAALQHADFASSTFSAANQFANSWASAYLAAGKTGMVKSGVTATPIYDHCYLTNEALWDGFFFSGAAPRLQPAATGKPSTAWKSPIASVERSIEQVLKEFVADPLAKPLGNSRMQLRKGGLTDDAIVKNLLDPAGCTRIASHLTVDGAFNVNSTDVDAWTAVLAGLRGEKFEVEGGSSPSSELTGFPRFRYPTGNANDNWNGFRTLNDPQVRSFAENLVKEIRLRGPFLSLAEFVNRRVEESGLGRCGAIQAAIDAGKLNDSTKQAAFSTANYPADAKNNIIADTGVGIPGYLTQADVLQSLAPVITCRSDTFTIRGYGEAKDAAGKVLARSWCEAVVQRTPDFVDATNAPDAAIGSITAINQTFGRRFEIISFRRIANAEIQ
jgi:hypothetical protein